MIARADAAAQSKLDRAGSGLHRVALRRAPRAHRTRETANELKVELPRRRVAIRASSTDVVEAARLALVAALTSTTRSGRLGAESSEITAVP